MKVKHNAQVNNMVHSSSHQLETIDIAESNYIHTTYWNTSLSSPFSLNRYIGGTGGIDVLSQSEREFGSRSDVTKLQAQ